MPERKHSFLHEVFPQFKWGWTIPYAFFTLGTCIFQRYENKQQVASISGSLHQGLRFSSSLQSPIVGLSSCRALPAGRPCSPSSTLPPLLQPGLSSLPQLPHRVPRSFCRYVFKSSPYFDSCFCLQCPLLIGQNICHSKLSNSLSDINPALTS